MQWRVKELTLLLLTLCLCGHTIARGTVSWPMRANGPTTRLKNEIFSSCIACNVCGSLTLTRWPCNPVISLEVRPWARNVGGNSFRVVRNHNSLSSVKSSLGFLESRLKTSSNCREEVEIPVIARTRNSKTTCQRATAYRREQFVHAVSHVTLGSNTPSRTVSPILVYFLFFCQLKSLQSR